MAFLSVPSQICSWCEVLTLKHMHIHIHTYTHTNTRSRPLQWSPCGKNTQVNQHALAAGERERDYWHPLCRSPAPDLTLGETWHPLCPSAAHLMLRHAPANVLPPRSAATCSPRISTDDESYEGEEDPREADGGGETSSRQSAWEGAGGEQGRLWLGALEVFNCLH